MLLERRILILLNRYMHDDSSRDRYAGTSEYYGKETNKAAFVAWLRYERHLKLPVIDRMEYELGNLKSRFGMPSRRFGKPVTVRRRFKLWHQKIYDAIDWCEQKGYVRIDLMSREKIELLPAGRRFTHILPFTNEVVKEYGALKSIVAGTGLATVLGAAITFIASHWPW